MKVRIQRRRLITCLMSGMLWVCTACSFILNTPEATALPGLAYAAELDAAIEGVLLANPAEQRLGISAALIVPGYQPWDGQSGYSYAEIAITAETLFDAGSIAKSFEAALVLKLAEEGNLDLDAPVSNFLPELKNVDPQITIRQLLDHTSGVYNVFEHPDFLWLGSDVDYSKNWELRQVFENFVLEPYGAPGQVQHYSSTNYLLVTAILSEVMPDTPGEAMNRRFFEPLALEHSYLSMGEQPPAKYSVAHPWVDIDLDGKLEDLYGIPLNWKVSLTHPVLFATAGDLARWMQALYSERSVLEVQSFEAMLTYPQVDQLDPEGGIYGLGVVDFTDRLGVHAIGHAGSALGYSAAALYLPEYEVSMAWMINTGESPPELAGSMMRDAWDALYQVVHANEAPAGR